MKIIIVSDAVYPYHKGGKERRFYEITTRLAKRGHDVHIYCMKWWKTPEKVRYEQGVYLHGFAPHFPLYKGKRRSIKQGIIFGLWCLKLIKEDWDILEVDHMPYFPLFFAKLVCVLKRKKMYATWNEVWGRKYWIKYMGFAGNISAFIEWLSSFLPDVFISISRHTSRRLKEVFDLPDKKIKTISTGLDTTAIEAVMPAKKKYDVIYAGRLQKHKNLPMLVKAMAQITAKDTKVTCVIVGNGYEKKQLIKQVADMKLQKNVFFEDFMPHHNDVFRLMKSAKVFVLPSTREGFGMAVLEANASGIPAVVINHPDNAAKDLIEKDNGVVVENTVPDIVRGITKYLKHTADPEKVKKVALQYSWERIVDNLEKYYESLVPRR